MNKMVLGTLTFTKNPSGMTQLKKERITSTVQTYTNVALFSWGTMIIGKTIELTFKAITIDMFTDLQALYEADVPVVWTPQDDSGHTYNVEITGLDATYFITPSVSDGAGYRMDVKLSLLIMSVAS